MDRKTLRWLLIASAFFFIVTGASVAMGEKPPWAGGGGGHGNPHDPPVSAPEPAALSMIGVAAGAVIGCSLRKRLFGFRSQATEDGSDVAQTKSSAFIPESRTGPG